MIYGNQVRAARGLLDWTVLDLSAKSGLQPNTITAFENSTRPATAETVTRLTQALEMAGIEFTPTGVQMASPIYAFTGPTAQSQLLDDVEKNLPNGGEVLVENVDDRKAPPELVSRLRSMRGAGISFRFTAEQDNFYLLMPTKCYRWIPKEHFKNWVMLTYENRVAFFLNGETRVTVINDKDLAESMRGRFNLVWDLLKPIDIESTAHDKIL